MNFDFHTEMNHRVNEIEQILKKFLPSEEGHQRTVIEAMNYSLLAGGKRLRPLFMLETYHLFGGKDSVIEYFAAAIEMIHTYSLVHDDLPAMDNDEYRRGIKTTHTVYGEAIGILAGDGLLNYAFETAIKAFEDCMDMTLVAQALRVLSSKAGIFGMIGGQCVDIEAVGHAVNMDKLSFIYHLKTGALLEASMLIGAILSGAGREDQEKIERIAADVGLAFQIMDDYLDRTSTTEILGKPVLSDEKNNKTTYVSLVGVDQAARDVLTISNRAINQLREIKGEKDFLAQLIESLIFRKN